MGKSYGAGIRIQAENPRAAALFYVEQLGFEITDISPDGFSLYGQQINLFIEQGPPLGPVIEMSVEDVATARDRLLKHGCEPVESLPGKGRTCLRDPYGVLYSLIAST